MVIDLLNQHRSADLFSNCCRLQIMLKLLFLEILLLLSCWGKTQAKTGVWEGILSVEPQGVVLEERIISARPVFRNATGSIAGVRIATESYSLPLYASKQQSIAAIEIKELNGQLLLLLYSFSPDKHYQIIYTLKGKANKKGEYFLRGEDVLLNETNAVAQPFDMRGRFIQQNQQSIFKGDWIEPFSQRVMGGFWFEQISDTAIFSSEMMQKYFKVTTAKTTPSIYADTLISNDAFIYIQLHDNGMVDGELYDLFLDDELIESGISPTKEIYFLRVKLKKKQQILKMKCVDEGKFAGAGIFLFLKLGNLLIKDQLHFTLNHQVEIPIQYKN